ncbi:MAG: Ig-like domain-containing protein [Baekduia sp.]
MFASTAPAATVPLNGRTFDAACKAASAGDVVTVPAGNYGGQNISCTKSVTLLAQGNVRLASLSFSNANGPTVDGVSVTGAPENGAASVMKSQNITIRNSTFNNMVYLEGAVDTLFDHDTWEPLDSSTQWSNGDMMDLYEQTRTPTPNTRVTVQDSVFHGLRAPNSAAHSDAIQICNCAASDAQHTIDFKILRTKFYDNECMNLRTNTQDEVTLENNLIGDTVRGISGCGDYSLDVLAANATVRYNTFTGSQKIQVNTSADVGQSQTWVGNAGNAMSTNCGAIRGTYAYNVWKSQKCSATDKQVSSLKLNSDGTPQSDSPVIDAGNPASFPSTDYNKASRPVGAAPDAGAFEFGGTTGMPDTVAPETTITSAPSNGTATTANVSFTSSESGGTFECRLDGGTWASCVSPKGYSGLAVGSHTVNVRATDAAGNTDATPAAATWTIDVAGPADTTPPETTITVAPSNGTATTASLSFTSNESGTFQCKLDAGSYGACTSPNTYTGLGTGSHTFSVRATDAAGNTDATPAATTWTISAAPPADTTAPTPAITSQPPATTAATNASFAFSGSDDTTPAGSLTFRCKLDSAAYAACTSPKAYSGLAAGVHTFRVRATDTAGNESASVSATWTIQAPDTAAPTVTFTSKPSVVSPTSSTTATFAFTGVDDRTAADDLTFRCALDDNDAEPCTSPDVVEDLGAGQHTFAVTATDAAGNVSAPATTTWKVIAVTEPPVTEPPVTEPPVTEPPVTEPPVTEPPVTEPPATGPLVPPTVALLRPAGGSTFRDTLRARATATDDGKVHHVEFWLDSRRFAYDTAAPYTGFLNTSRVRAGAHTLVARAVDDEGLSSSVGIAVERVRRVSSVSSGLVQATALPGDDSTALSATGPKSGKIAVGLTSCDDGQAKVVKTVTMVANKAGRAGQSVPTGDLCVASVTLRK